MPYGPPFISGSRFACGTCNLLFLCGYLFIMYKNFKKYAVKNTSCKNRRYPLILKKAYSRIGTL
ncbi:hypothetical protein ROSINTL182_08611 [Roseburia intestinalis L1-82]|uniref:Uncharacterized protein n=1 Tax=Roseburia intestinalis L1-82 TaxID=536231 RepID=C7GFA5_9FIRM|nr:hypothetical protein ROSINTL182_08611 [Roseburia intestinalis L1-82]